tara:strand:- start:1368 stop:1595 length:228 start_codon:yes stop_codon:yes gene_type:complete
MLRTPRVFQSAARAFGAGVFRFSVARSPRTPVFVMRKQTLCFLCENRARVTWFGKRTKPVMRVIPRATIVTTAHH